MNRTRRMMIVGGSILALAAGGAGVAAATGTGGESGEAGEQASGPGADQATKAALEITQGGTANSVERDSENGATWEVEVTKTDGNTVDVRLDEGYNLVVVEGDGESPDASK